jgi:hypothetical protein
MIADFGFGIADWSIGVLEGWSTGGIEITNHKSQIANKYQ